MKLTFSASLALLILPLSLFAGDSLYCPQNHAYINLGMTPDQVIAACGQPLTQEESKEPFTQKVPVQQLIFNNMGTATAFYGVWNMQTGGSGSQLEVDVVNRKVRSIKLNGSDSNSASICNGVSIQADDPVEKVYNACGSPSLVNNSFINMVIPTPEKPKIWVYQPGQFQPTVSLTFVNGRLQSIN